MGQHDLGQQDREPLRGKSASERTSKRVSEVFRGVQRVFRGFFRGPLRDPLRGRFPSQRLSVLLPLNLSPGYVQTISFS